MDCYNVELVYRATMSFLGSAKAFYHKLNWDYVCSPECALEMRMAWHNSFKRRVELKGRIASEPTLPKIDFKPDDDYRIHILKLCRLDPRLYPNLEVMHFSQQPWIYS